MAKSVGGTGVAGLDVGSECAPSEFDHAGSRWLGTMATVGRPAPSASVKLTMARMDIDQALRTCRELGWLA